MDARDYGSQVVVDKAQLQEQRKAYKAQNFVRRSKDDSGKETHGGMCGAGSRPIKSPGSLLSSNVRQSYKSSISGTGVYYSGIFP